MLKLLFSSETRVKLLSLFLLHTDKRYSQAQLVAELKVASMAINKELENLVKFGLIIENEELVEPAIASENKSLKIKPGSRDKKLAESQKKYKKYFFVNKTFILYQEIKALFVKAQVLSSQNFILSLEKNFSAKLVILTGLFVNYPEAQTDLLIVGRIKKPPFLKLIAQLEKDLGREINFTIMDEREFYYRREIMDIFLYNILEGRKIILSDYLLNK